MHTHSINADFDPNNFHTSFIFNFYLYRCIPLNTLPDSNKTLPHTEFNFIFMLQFDGE